MKICHGDTSIIIEDQAVWVDGVKICRVDMAKGIIAVEERVKLVKLNFPKGITITPFNKEYKGKQKILEVVAATVR